jgi:hypothetical protein
MHKNAHPQLRQSCCSSSLTARNTLALSHERPQHFLGAFAKLRKATISVAMSVRLSVRMELDFHWMDFDETWCLSFFFFFGKIFREKSSIVTILRVQWVFYVKAFRHLWKYLAEFFWEWEMFQIKVEEKIKIHISCPVTFLRKSCHLWVHVEEIWRSQRGRR